MTDTEDDWSIFDYEAGHGACMFFAFPVTFFGGFLVARFANNHAWWMKAHYALQSIGSVAVFGGAGFVVMMIKAGGFQWSLHSVLGLLILFLIVLQIFLGFLTHRWFNASRVRLPLFPDVMHHWTGRVVIFCGIGNVFLGLKQIGAVATLFFCYLALCAVLLMVFLYLEYLAYQRDLSAFSQLTHSATAFGSHTSDTLDPIVHILDPGPGGTPSIANGGRVKSSERTKLLVSGGFKYAALSTNAPAVPGLTRTYRARKRGDSTGSACSSEMRALLMDIAFQRGYPALVVAEWLAVFETEDVLSMRDMRIISKEKEYWLTLNIPKMILMEIEGKLRRGSGSRALESPRTMHAAAPVTDVSEELSSSLRTIQATPDRSTRRTQGSSEAPQSDEEQRRPELSPRSDQFMLSPPGNMRSPPTWRKVDVVDLRPESGVVVPKLDVASLHDHRNGGVLPPKRALSSLPEQEMPQVTDAVDGKRHVDRGEELNSHGRGGANGPEAPSRADLDGDDEDDGIDGMSSLSSISGPVPTLQINAASKMASKLPDGFDEQKPHLFVQYKSEVSMININFGISEAEFNEAVHRAFPLSAKAGGTVVGVLDSAGFVLPVKFISRHHTELERFVPYIIVFDEKTADETLERQEVMVFDVAGNRFRYGVVAV